MNRKNIKKIIRGIVSLSLMIFLLHKANLRDVWNLIISIDIYLFVFAILLSIANTVVSAYRWRVLLNTKRINISLKNATVLYFIGSFFNNFLPTSFGGDAVRAYEFSKSSHNVEDTVTSVFMDRFIGVVTLIPIVLFAVLIGPNVIRSNNILLSILLLVLACFVSILILFNKEIAKRLSFFIKPFLSNRWVDKTRGFYDAIYSYKEYKRELKYSVLISFVYQAVNIFAIVLLALSLNLRIPVIYFFVFIPIITVVAMLPISINGFGVQDGSYIFLFNEIGVTTANALSMSILTHVLRLSCGLVGGAIYILRK